MSYSDNNNSRPDAGYPMTPKKQKSPWLYVGLGCLGLFVLSFGACATIGVIGMNKYKEVANQPVDEASIAQEFQGIPTYPGGKLNAEITKVTRGILNIFTMATPGKKFHIGAYKVPDAPEKVMEWYDAKMAEAGYSETKQIFKLGNNSDEDGQGIAKMYKKDKDLVQIQAREGKKGKVLIMLRFEGFTEEELAGFKS
jgi:hypothetical protein